MRAMQNNTNSPVPKPYKTIVTICMDILQNVVVSFVKSTFPQAYPNSQDCIDAIFSSFDKNNLPPIDKSMNFDQIITSLDLSAFLRLIIYNWKTLRGLPVVQKILNENLQKIENYNLREQEKILTYSHEIISDRNIVSHVQTIDISKDDAHRSLNTMSRLCRLLDTVEAEKISKYENMLDSNTIDMSIDGILKSPTISSQNQNSNFLETLYLDALQSKYHAITAQDFANAAKLFEKVSNYKDAHKHHSDCLKLKQTIENETAQKAERGYNLLFGNGVQKNINAAIPLLEEAAQAGNANAEYTLGYCHENGIYYTKNPATAVKLYLSAAQKGSVQAHSNLGYCYQNGIGIKQNIGKAVHHYQIAANANNILGCLNLGWCYENGIGVAKVPEEAVRLYRIAAKGGNAVAHNNLGHCYQRGYGVEHNLELAYQEYSIAAEAGNGYALANLGYLYETGMYVKKNLKIAKDYYQKAYDAGHSVSQQSINRINEILSQREIDLKTNIEKLKKIERQPMPKRFLGSFPLLIIAIFILFILLSKIIPMIFEIISGKSIGRYEIILISIYEAVGCILWGLLLRDKDRSFWDAIDELGWILFFNSIIIPWPILIIWYLVHNRNKYYKDELKRRNNIVNDLKNTIKQLKNQIDEIYIDINS